MFERVRSLGFKIMGKEASVHGLWERFGDDFEGCVILVEEVAEGLRGRITYVPATMRRFGWMVGDIKWRNMRRGRVAAFKVDDLFKELDHDTQKLKKTTYEEARIYFLSDSELIVMAGSRGRPTRWRRSGSVSKK